MIVYTCDEDWHTLAEAPEITPGDAGTLYTANKLIGLKPKQFCARTPMDPLGPNAAPNDTVIAVVPCPLTIVALVGTLHT